MRVSEIGPALDVADVDAGQRSVGLGRGLEVEHRLERLELDLDELDAVLGERLALGDHERDRLARINDLLAGERLEQATLAAALDRQIAGGQYGDHAWDLERGLGADRPDHRVRLVRQDEASVQQSGDLRVGGIAGGSSDL